jgi:quinol monooxygenase YgiN
MTAFNVVRFKVRPGCQQQFIDLHRRIRPAFKGFLSGDLVQTGERTFFLVGKWRDMNAIVAARPEMIGVLDQLRDLLEDLGGGLGVTDPVSGESVASVTPPPARKKKKKSAAKKKSTRAKKATARKKSKATKKTKKKSKKKAKAKAKAKKKSTRAKKSKAGASRAARGRGKKASKRSRA